MSGKKKLCLQEALDLLQSLLFEINDVLTDNFSDEEVPANYLLEFSLYFLDDDQEAQGAVVHVKKTQHFLPQDAVL
ncbi:hypothetical protein TNCV_4523201 [Trichonephila clavipes]|nr:hypothetical protein TNCV_4523201 [Trichonephila clavipes]